MFDLIRDISDPEHPLSLEQLNIVQARCTPRAAAAPRLLTRLQLSKIWVDDANSRVAVEFVPTIPHCRWRVTCCVTCSTSPCALTAAAAQAPSSDSPSASSCRCPPLKKRNRDSLSFSETAVAALPAAALQNQRQDIQRRASSGIYICEARGAKGFRVCVSLLQGVLRTCGAV